MTYSRTHQWVSNFIMILVTLAMVIPLLLLFTSSLTDEKMLIANGYSFFPEKLSLNAYQYIASNSTTIFKAYGITIIATVLGTGLGLFITALMGFALSIRDLPGKNIISFFIFFTMLFNGGLVPSYIMWTSFGIVNTIWAYIFPFLLTNAFTIILVRSYYASNIPNEVYESAKIDGAGYFRIFQVIGLPLGKPILVTVGLFACLAYWNDWQNGLYFINDPSMLSIQALLNKMNQNVQAVITYTSTGSSNTASIPHVSIRMAIACVAILPILAVYPFLQKYFASGIMGGAVKG